MNNKLKKSQQVYNLQEVKVNNEKIDSDRIDVGKSYNDPGQESRISKTWLKVAAGICFLMAACQAVISISPDIATYFGAPPSLTENRFLLYITGSIATLILVIFGLYALSGAGSFFRLPFVRIVLIFISSVFLLRASFLILTVLRFLNIVEGKILIRELISHLIFFAAGLTYTGGTILNWTDMARKTKLRNS